MTVDATSHRVNTRIDVVPDALTAEECDAIIEGSRPYAIEHEPEGGGRLTAHPVDDFHERLGHRVEGKLWDMVAYFNHASRWRIPLDPPMGLARAGVSRYGVGDFMALHVDDDERDDDPAGWDLPHRGISMSVPLSGPGEYSGGGLRLYSSAVREGGWSPDGNQYRERWRLRERSRRVATGPLGRGDAVLFGSSLPHEVMPVTAGTRWVLLWWAYTNHHLNGLR